MMPETTFLGDTYRFNYPDLDIEIQLDHFAEDSRDGLKAEATILTTRQPRPGLLVHGRLNLSSSQSQATMTRLIEKRNGESGFLADVSFSALLSQVCFLALQRYRQGAETICLADVELSGKNKYLLYPFIQDRAICVLFGDGESGKSTLALAMALSVATGTGILGPPPAYTAPVLYLDWEADPETHTERLRAMAAGLGLSMPRNIYYRRESATLSETAGALRKEIAEMQYGLIIIDSVGMAGGDEPEKAKAKMTLFSAARSFEKPVLAIDHVSKQDASKPYGSVYTRNIARIAWAVQKSSKEGENKLIVGLRNDKINHGRRHKTCGFEIEYEDANDSLTVIRFAPTDLATVPEMQKMAPLDNVIQNILLLASPESLTVKQIHNELVTVEKKATEATIRTTLNRHCEQGRRLFRRIDTPKEMRWTIALGGENRLV